MNSCFSLNDTTFYALLHSYILIKSHNPGAQFYLKGDLHACFLCPLFSDGETSITDSCAQFPLKLLSTESSGKKKEQQQKSVLYIYGGKDTAEGQRKMESWKMKEKMEENHEGTAAEDKMHYSIILQEQRDRSMSEFQKSLPLEILCHRCCCCCCRIEFRHPSKACWCPGGKINSSTYCSSKPKLPCKDQEGWETWDPWRILSILSLTQFSASLFSSFSLYL